MCTYTRGARCTLRHTRDYLNSNSYPQEESQPPKYLVLQYSPFDAQASLFRVRQSFGPGTMFVIESSKKLTVDVDEESISGLEDSVGHGCFVDGTW